MEVLAFGYNLTYEPRWVDENPISPTEAPLNPIAVARTSGPNQAVVWDYDEKDWTFQPGVAAAVLYANPEEHRTRHVDRATAEREVMRFAMRPLPSEEELTAICRAGLQT